ncbi:hypothetical protein DNH61_21365 [Paenibacillus sambharensis]|uniref:LppX_LprAFG lipoprotein n=1 Tax=Paenibacillus sambharensis TaxID=1803190 RepID=A0A2W1LH16_9BACL|nr:DUF6612 family protein [Paenibacillus sambharensis]PZD93754.1 hypothetical protein DNH61_21365 [Paenibacillus sambharensis]
MKWYVTGMIALLLVMTGCSSNQQEIETPAKQEEKQQEEIQPEENQQADSAVNIEELIKSTKINFVESHSLKLDTSMESTVKEDGNIQKGLMRVAGDLTFGPVGFHASMTEDEVTVEAYYVDDAAYVKPDGQDLWYKLPNTDTEGLSEFGNIKEETVKFLNFILSLKDDLKVTDEGGVYKISYETTGNSNEIEKIITDSLDGLLIDANFVVNSLRYELSVQKGSHEITESRVIMDLSLKNESGVVMSRMIIDTKSLFSDFNKLDKIVVPQEIINTASEIPSE